MSTILSALLAHWRIVAVGALLAATVTLFVSWRTGIEEAAAARALAEVAQERLEHSLDIVDSLRAHSVQRDSLAAQIERELASEREKNQRIEQAASESARQAEAQVALTLDSLRAAPSPELVDELEAQIEEEREAHRSVVQALRVQLTAADSMTVLWRSRHTDAVSVSDAQAVALEEAQAALVARTAHSSQGSWSDPVVGVLKYVGVFAAGYVIARR